MGSELAIAAAVDIGAMGLETEPAGILARGLQDFDALHVVDNNTAETPEGGPKSDWANRRAPKAPPFGTGNPRVNVAVVFPRGATGPGYPDGPDAFDQGPARPHLWQRRFATRLTGLRRVRIQP